MDGPTSGPDAWTGPIGKRIVEDVWLLPIVKFNPVPGKIQPIGEEVLADLSRDQCLLYKLGMAVQTGVVSTDIAAATIGPPLHARWLTTAARDLRYSQIYSETNFFFMKAIIFRDYMSTRQPSAKQKEIISLIVCFYIPNYFHIKTNPTIQDGAQNIFFMLTLSKELKPGSRATVERVLQGNSFFAHHENIIIGMLRDEDEEVRRQAVLYIRQRNKLNFEFHKT